MDEAKGASDEDAVTIERGVMIEISLAAAGHNRDVHASFKSKYSGFCVRTFAYHGAAKRDLLTRARALSPG